MEEELTKAIPIEFYADEYVQAYSCKMTMQQAVKDVVNNFTIRSLEQLSIDNEENLKEMGLPNCYDIIENLALALEELEVSEFYDNGRLALRSPDLIKNVNQLLGLSALRKLLHGTSL